MVEAPPSLSAIYSYAFDNSALLDLVLFVVSLQNKMSLVINLINGAAVRRLVSNGVGNKR